MKAQSGGPFHLPQQFLLRNEREESCLGSEGLEGGVIFFPRFDDVWGHFWLS